VDFISTVAFFLTIASKADIDGVMAQRGVGVFLSTLQRYLPINAFAEVCFAIPAAAEMLFAVRFDSASGMQSNTTSAKTGIVHEAQGNDSEARTVLLYRFSEAGFSLEAAKQFLSAIFHYLKEKVSPDTITMIEQSIPVLDDFLLTDESGRFMREMLRMLKERNSSLHN
jgi:hypothetical protein